jgi:DNA-binding HxlR family transcriptional regulator
MQKERVKAMAKKELSCPVETTLAVIGGRWKVLILQQLLDGVQRFNQLHRALAGVTHKTLAQQLREMEQDGIVHREVYPQIPPKVEYSLTPLGETLRPLLDAMHQWAVKHGSGRGAGKKRIGRDRPVNAR